MTLARSGRTEEGLARLREARRLDPRSAHAAADLGHALANAGRADEARAILGELRDLARQRPVSPYDFALVHAGLGEADAALDRLEEGYAERANGLRWLKVEPGFAALRSQPRFRDLLRRIGLPS
jgi:Flp pilus assembly protein TadD